MCSDKVSQPQGAGSGESQASLLGLGKDGLIERFGNTSNAIRALHALGVKAGPISRALDIRFQHVRNVVERPLKRVIAAERKAKKEQDTQEE